MGKSSSRQQCLVLGMETSCDETSAAVIADGRIILSNVISSQVPLHQKYGGVVPEIASRKHSENILPVVQEALKTAGVTLGDLQAVAVTCGPGLVGALLVGVAAAKALSFALDIPLVGVNHLEGHIFANFLAHTELKPPFVALVVSGGHTSLLHVTDYNEFHLLGQTRDDAAGEAFDKIARVMGLPYPGGPQVERLAQTGDADAIVFPRALIGENFEFSFSGLKSAVLSYLHNAAQHGQMINPADIAAGFQVAVIDVLVDKTMRALAYCQSAQVVIGGGVAANSRLKMQLEKACAAVNARVYYPQPVLCTDNAAMIACRAYYQYQAGHIADLHLNAAPALRIGTSWQ